MDNKKHKGCTPFSVSVVFAIVIICYKMCEPPPPPFVTQYLKYYYCELPQDSLECLIKKKVFKLKDDWYYEDFDY